MGYKKQPIAFVNDAQDEVGVPTAQVPMTAEEEAPIEEAKEEAPVVAQEEKTAPTATLAPQKQARTTLAPEQTPVEQQALTQAPNTPENSVSARQAVGAFAQNQATQQPQANHDPNAWMASYKTPTAQEYNDDDMKFMQDLATRQIKPKDYQQLFANKSTLGKIGSIFGLMLAGAGSGLTKQPNLLLDMMNKEIDRDLESQQKNRANAQTFLQLAYNHELQKAQGTNMYAQANDLNVKNAGLAAVNRAKNMKLAAAYQNISDLGGSNPQAQQIIEQQIKPAVMQQMQQNNEKAAGAQALNTSMYMKQQAQNAPIPQFDQGIDYGKLRKLSFLGKNAPEMPGAIPPQDMSSVEREARDVATNRAITHIWENSFKELNDSLTANKFNPQRRAALIDAVATRISKDTGAMSTEQASKILDGMFPTASDRLFPGNIAEKYKKGIEHFAGMEAATPALDRYGLKTPFPQTTMPERKTKQKHLNTENNDTKVVNGVTYKRGPDGKAIRVNQAASK